jgi:hypothetical protein
MKDNVVISDDQMTAFDTKYGKRYQAIVSKAGDGCRGCNVRQGRRLCLALPCSNGSNFKPVRKDGQETVWIHKQPEIQK